MKSIQQDLTKIIHIDHSREQVMSLKTQMELYNTQEGNLRGHDCRVCRNKGYVMIQEEGYAALKSCECLKARQSKTIIEKSGLKKLIHEYSLQNYLAKENWQRIIKDTAERFLQDPETHWFFIGGQVGSGKTHICTAIVNELMNQGKEALYMLWRDESVRLKAVSNDGEYSKLIEPFKTKEVLYIDDLFKSEKGKQPSTADINIAFEILNARYQNTALITIISSERIIRELIEIDEATGSRIYQMSKGYYLELKHDPRMNMRLRERKAHE